MSTKYNFRIIYNDDISTFSLPSSSTLSKLKTIIESLFDNLKSSPYDLHFSKTSLLSFQHSLPLSSIFSSLTSSPNGQPFSFSSEIPLTITTKSLPSLSTLLISIKIIFNKNTFLFDNINASLPFENLKFKLLAMYPEINQEDHQIIYNNIDIANIHNNKKPLYKVLNINNACNANEVYEIIIKSFPKRIVQSLKKCSYCRVVKADYMCTKCAIATCNGCANKEMHYATRDVNYVKMEGYREYEQKYLEELLGKLRGMVNENNALQSDSFDAIMKEEKLNVISQKFQELIAMLNLIYKEQYDNLKMLLEDINEKYHPMEISSNLKELIEDIVQYKMDPYFDCEEAMKKVLSFKAIFTVLYERFELYVKALKDFHQKYKKCMDIIAKIRKCLEESLYETRILFGSDDIKRTKYNSLMRVYDSEHVLVFDPNNEKFNLVEMIDDEFLFKNNFGNFIQTNIVYKNTQKMFVVTGIPCQLLFVYDLCSKEMSFVAGMKYNHNWWPGLITIKRKIDSDNEDIIVFCLSGSYTTKCEMLIYGTSKSGDNGMNKEVLGDVPIVDNILNIKDSIENQQQQNENEQQNGEEQLPPPEEQQQLPQENSNALSQYKYKWLEIPSTEVSHGQGGTFIFNNTFIYLIYGYDASQRPISLIERLNIESIHSLPLIFQNESPLKWESLSFENPDNISSYLYYNSLLKISDTEIYILGGLIETDQVDVIYRLDCAENKILKTDTKLNFHSVKFNFEKHFLLLNRDTSILSEPTEYGIIDGKNKAHIIKSKLFEHKTFIYNP